jgi:hypothetical protein
MSAGEKKKCERLEEEGVRRPLPNWREDEQAKWTAFEGLPCSCLHDHPDLRAVAFQDLGLSVWFSRPALALALIVHSADLGGVESPTTQPHSMRKLDDTDVLLNSHCETGRREA